MRARARAKGCFQTKYIYAEDGVINKNGFFKTAVISGQAEVDAKYFEELSQTRATAFYRFVKSPS